NKDDDLLNPSHQRTTRSDFPQSPATGPQEVHTAQRENTTHLGQTASAYTTITNNPWLQTDTDSYFQYRVDQIPVEKVTAVLQAVFQRAEARINSFSYFVKEIAASVEKRTAGGRRRKLAAILHRVRQNHVGSAEYSISDLVFD